MMKASYLRSSSWAYAVSSASKLAHCSGAPVTPSSETRHDSISLRIVVPFPRTLLSGELVAQGQRHERIVGLSGFAGAGAADSRQPSGPRTGDGAHPRGGGGSVVPAAAAQREGAGAPLELG